jgi:WhiB family redox-sensing transcriptional regulator
MTRQVTGNRRVDDSVQEMIELIELSSLGTPAVQRLRALAGPAVADRLIEAEVPLRRGTVHPATEPSAESEDDSGTRRAPGVGPPAGRIDTEWMAHGNCAQEPPGTLFPVDGIGTEVARRICADCPVRQECLEYALANRIDHGVWGGASERERRRILKRRRLALLAKTGSPVDGR